MHKVTALSVLSNAVLVWNTVRIGAILDELAAAGHVVAREDLGLADARCARDRDGLVPLRSRRARPVGAVERRARDLTTHRKNSYGRGLE